MAGRGRPGRPSKGVRAHLSTKIPKVFDDAINAEAKHRGVDRTTVVVEALAARFGLPVPFDVQETLPLTDAA
jgi:hypothetical protein